MKYYEEEIEKIEICRVPKKVRVSIEEQGSEVTVKTSLKHWRHGTPLPHTVNHATKTLVISLTDMKNDEEGTISVRVPPGYKRKTSIKKR